MTIAKRDITRRTALKASGTAALLAAAKSALPSGAFAQGAGPEVRGAKLGYIALTDSAPLIVARERGLFAKHGVPDVDVARQASWGATRDNIVLGGAANGIDGAHILRPMIHTISSGLLTQNNVPTPLYNLLQLNEDMQGISVSNEYRDLNVQKDSSPLKQAFERKRARGGELTAAMTFPAGPTISGSATGSPPAASTRTTTSR